VASEELRRRLGDIWDGLLIQEASTSRLSLELPYHGLSVWFPTDNAADPLDPSGSEPVFRSTWIETLSFSTLDAVDFLTAENAHPRDELQWGDSIRFWRCAARFVLGLLEGEQMFIKPEGFDQVHDRSGIEHRLKDPKKWVPLGIGAGEEPETPSQT